MLRKIKNNIYSEPILKLPINEEYQKLTRSKIKQINSDIIAFGKPIDVFFMQIQGSGKIKFANGEMKRAAYSGNNDKPYVSIGQILINEGELLATDASKQSIELWMRRAGHEQTKKLINKNPRYIFFKEELNKKRILSIILVVISIVYLLLISFKSLPWVGIIVALSWGFYNLVRKKINVDTDVGLLIESLYILPLALIAFYIIAENGFNDFQISNPPMMLLIFLAGPMTVIPLFLYVRGVELCGLGATGMIFYITPTLQFILGYFYYDEPFSMEKLVSFIFIWIAVIIYLKDLHETN